MRLDHSRKSRITNVGWSISDYLCALINSIREISFLGVSRYIIGYLSWKIESDRFCWIRSPIVTEREEREEHLIDTSLWIQSWKIQFSYFHAFVILLIVKKIHQRWQASTRIYTKERVCTYTRLTKPIIIILLRTGANKFIWR